MPVELEEGRQMAKEKLEQDKSSNLNQFINMLTNSIITSDLKEQIKEQYRVILPDNEQIPYHVLSKTSGKDETILTFIEQEEKCINVPNIILPEEVNRRTILNYINGEFKVNVEQTKKNNEQWEREQEKEEILKENRTYKVTWLANDFTQVMAEDTKQIYRFDFMQDYVPLNLKRQLQEGDKIIAKDGKFEKLGEKLEKKQEDTYLGVGKPYRGKAGKIYMVTEVQSQVIKIYDMEKKEEQFVKKEEIELKKGDFIKTKRIGYEKYNGVVEIKNEHMKKEIKNWYDNIF